MNYYIQVRPIYTIDNTLFVGKVDDERYLSKNWSYLSDYFSISNHLIGRCGKEVAINIQNAIDKLKSEGVEMTKSEKENPDWWWALQGEDNPKSNKKYTENGKKGIFIYHLYIFLDIANSFPESYFFCNIQETCNVYKDGNVIGVVKGYLYLNDIDEKEVPNSSFYTWEKCLDLYGRARINHDPNAEAWFELACSLPDAPKSKESSFDL